MNRSALAIQIASGFAGWQQLQTVQNIGDLSGEDTARFIISQIINAQGKFAPATSQLPPNWGGTKKRVDVALLARSAGSVVWYGAIADEWGRLVARCERRGRPIHAMDALIAATAQVHGLSLVTRNTADFQASVSALLNPWTQRRPTREYPRRLSVVSSGVLRPRDEGSSKTSWIRRCTSTATASASASLNASTG